MANGTGREESDESNLTRRDTLAAGVLGLGLVGAGTASATSAEENDDDDDEGDGGGSSQFAVREHDHSGEFGGTSSLGAEAPVDSITVTDIVNTEQPVFDIRAYGAVGDGKTDNTEAIHAAIDDAAEVDGAVLFPRGDWVSDWIILRHEHNGVTLTGVGYGSRIIPLQTVDPEAAWTWTTYGGDDPIIDIPETNFTRGIFLNDNFSPPSGTHPASLGEFDFNYREPEPFENITIRNLHLDGRNEELIFDPFGDDHDDPFVPSGFGIATTEAESENILIENVWAHYWNSNGIRVSSGGTIVDRCFLNRNNFHGLAAGSGTSRSPALVSNVYCVENGFYGIDTGGATNINNFVCLNNGWGVKINGGPHVLANGSIYNSGKLERDFRTGGVGFQAISGASQVYLNNVETRNSDSTGFNFRNMEEVRIGKIASIGDSDDGGAAAGIRVHRGEDYDLQADQIVVQSANGHGLLLDDTGSVRINDLIAEYNDGAGLLHQGATDELLVHGGRIRNNEGAGVELQGGRRIVLGNLRIEDDRDDPTQTIGVDVASDVGRVTLRDLDLRGSPTPVAIANGADPEIENVAGFATDAGGIATFSGDGDATTFTVGHGLATTPTRLNVTPDLSTDAVAVEGIENRTESSFDVVFSTAPAEGSDNAVVSWSASVY